jgi:hypothetical protein
VCNLLVVVSGCEGERNSRVIIRSDDERFFAAIFSQGVN